MARINLSIDNRLFNKLAQNAKDHNCTINVFLVSLLESLYMQEPFNYEEALRTLETEAKAQPMGKEFALADLPSFQKICVAKAEKAQLKPSTVRGRLGKMFNRRVATHSVGDVKRAVDESGGLRFISRAAVYIRKDEELR